jgi:hypothetical protein
MIAQIQSPKLLFCPIGYLSQSDTGYGIISHECTSAANGLAAMDSDDCVRGFRTCRRGVAFRGGPTVRPVLQQLRSFEFALNGTAFHPASIVTNAECHSG